MRTTLRLRERFLILRGIFGWWGMAAIVAFEVAFLVKVTILVTLFL